MRDFLRLRECGCDPDRAFTLRTRGGGGRGWQQEANTYIIYEVISCATEKHRARKEMENDARVWGVFHVTWCGKASWIRYPWS